MHLDALDAVVNSLPGACEIDLTRIRPWFVDDVDEPQPWLGVPAGPGEATDAMDEERFAVARRGAPVEGLVLELDAVAVSVRDSR